MHVQAHKSVLHMHGFKYAFLIHSYVHRCKRTHTSTCTHTPQHIHRYKKQRVLFAINFLRSRFL